MTATSATLLLGQIEFYWDAHLWPRLQGMTDDEYLWEPVDGAWSLRRDSAGTIQIELTPVDPPVPPVTTIAWRLAHLGRDVWGKRGRALFGPTPAPADADMFDERHWPEPLPLTADGGLDLLREGYELWRDHLLRLDDDALAEPLGPRGGPYAEDSLAALVLHLNREAMAHGAEICLLRDLYRAQRQRRDPVVAAALASDQADLERRLRQDGGLGGLPDRHPTLLVELAGLGRWDAVRSLVVHDFPVTATADDGSTALHYAAATGTTDDARLLLERGADPTAVDGRFGMTPAGWADYLGHPELAALLGR